jgi:ParB/RepB/Spo0J family partition protein
MTTAVARTVSTDQEGSPQGESTTTRPGELFSIPTDQVHESPFNPRKHFDSAALEDLAASIRASGQLVPVIVRPRPNGDGYELAAGHRRLRAAKLAGLSEILAVVRHYDDKLFLEVLTIENLQRDDLHPLEEAQGFADLMKHAGYDVPKIAARTGRSEKYVYDRLKLLQLIPAAKKLFLEGLFEAGHAIILARLTPDQQEYAIGDLEDVSGGSEFGGPRNSLLFRPQTGTTEELPLHDQVKPVSVREFQNAVQHHTRATPDRVDPFLFPETVQALEAAKEEKLSVIHITWDHRVADDAKDEKIRTYGNQSWERADGATYTDEFGDRVKSKTCDFSRFGYIVAGRDQGQVLRVCVNKDKCKVHWPEQVAAFERRKKAAKKDAKAGGTTNRDKETQRVNREIEQRREAQQKDQEELVRWTKARPQLLEALAKAIKGAPVKPSADAWDIVRDTFGHSETAAKQFPVGKTAEDLIRHLAYTHLAARLGTDYWIREFAPKALKRFGLDAKSIVDEVSPPAKSADVSKASKTPKKAKAGKAKAKK